MDDDTHYKEKLKKLADYVSAKKSLYPRLQIKCAEPAYDHNFIDQLESDLRIINIDYPDQFFRDVHQKIINSSNENEKLKLILSGIKEKGGVVSTADYEDAMLYRDLKAIIQLKEYCKDIEPIIQPIDGYIGFIEFHKKLVSIAKEKGDGDSKVINLLDKLKQEVAGNQVLGQTVFEYLNADVMPRITQQPSKSPEVRTAESLHCIVADSDTFIMAI